MPYNPGVTDRSGEIYAQGLMSAAQSLAGGISSAANIYTKDQEETKTLTAQNKALETLLKTGGPSLGIQQSDIDALTTPSADESPRAINAKLTTVLQGAFTQRELKSRAIQDQLAQTQAAGEQQSQKLQLQQALDALAQRGRSRTLFGGTPSSDETGAMLQTGSNFSDLLPGQPPASPADAIKGSLAAGITDPRLLDAIGKYADAQPWTPTLKDLGSGVLMAMTSPKSAQSMTKPAPAARDSEPEYSADGKMFRSGPGDKWQPVPNDPSVRPLTLNEWMVSGGMDPSGALGKSYAEYRTKYQQEKANFDAQNKTPPAAGGTSFSSADDVRAAFKAGTIDKATALKILQTQFGLK